MEFYAGISDDIASPDLCVPTVVTEKSLKFATQRDILLTDVYRCTVDTGTTDYFNAAFLLDRIAIVTGSKKLLSLDTSKEGKFLL